MLFSFHSSCTCLGPAVHRAARAAHAASLAAAPSSSRRPPPSPPPNVYIRRSVSLRHLRASDTQPHVSARAANINRGAASCAITKRKGPLVRGGSSPPLAPRHQTLHHCLTARVNSSVASASSRPLCKMSFCLQGRSSNLNPVAKTVPGKDQTRQQSCLLRFKCGASHSMFPFSNTGPGVAGHRGLQKA